MVKEHHVIIAPGMDGRTKGIEFLTRNWPEKFGLIPWIIPIVWKDREPFSSKLEFVTDWVDKFTDQGKKVSLVGCSAGGILMLNVFCERIDSVYRVVNNCGFSTPGVGTGRYSFKNRSAISPSFREGVLRFTNKLPELSSIDRLRILTLRSYFDELVHPSSTVIDGAVNLKVHMVEHILTISKALTHFDPLIKFINQ